MRRVTKELPANDSLFIDKNWEPAEIEDRLESLQNAPSCIRVIILGLTRELNRLREKDEGVIDKSDVNWVHRTAGNTAQRRLCKRLMKELEVFSGRQTKESK